MNVKFLPWPSADSGLDAVPPWARMSSGPNVPASIGSPKSTANSMASRFVGDVAAVVIVGAGPVRSPLVSRLPGDSAIGLPAVSDTAPAPTSRLRDGVGSLTEPSCCPVRLIETAAESEAVVTTAPVSWTRPPSPTR